MDHFMHIFQYIIYFFALSEEEAGAEEATGLVTSTPYLQSFYLKSTTMQS